MPVRRVKHLFSFNLVLSKLFVNKGQAVNVDTTPFLLYFGYISATPMLYSNADENVKYQPGAEEKPNTCYGEFCSAELGAYLFF